MFSRFSRKALFLLCLVMICSVVLFGFVACNDNGDDGGDLPDPYADWMSWIPDDVMYRDISLLLTHNSGCIDVWALKGRFPQEVLNCQQGTIYDQLMYGVRSFDLRMTTDERTGKIVCSHGTGYGIPLEEVFADMARFTAEHEGEFITMWVKLYDSNPYSHAKAEVVKETFEILEPEKYFMDDSYNINEMTMGEIRASGKRYAVRCDESWCDYVNTTCIFPRTYNGEYNSGALEKGEACYDYMWDCLKNADENERIRLSLQRGAGGIVGDVTPFQFMKYDREYFLELMEKIASDEHALKVCAGASIDFATYDYVQCGKVLELNVYKGVVKDPDTYLKLLQERYSLPPVDLDGRDEALEEA